MQDHYLLDECLAILDGLKHVNYKRHYIADNGHLRLVSDVAGIEWDTTCHHLINGRRPKSYNNICKCLEIIKSNRNLELIRFFNEQTGKSGRILRIEYIFEGKQRQSVCVNFINSTIFSKWSRHDEALDIINQLNEFDYVETIERHNGNRNEKLLVLKSYGIDWLVEPSHFCKGVRPKSYNICKLCVDIAKDVDGLKFVKFSRRNKMSFAIFDYFGFKFEIQTHKAKRGILPEWLGHVSRFIKSSSYKVKKVKRIDTCNFKIIHHVGESPISVPIYAHRLQQKSTELLKLYCVKILNKNSKNEFFKIGVTKNEIKNRFQSIGKSFEIISQYYIEGDFLHISELEQNILEWTSKNGYRYRVHDLKGNWCAGWTECFRHDVLQEYEEKVGF